jgi:hypothetical protein
VVIPGEDGVVEAVVAHGERSEAYVHADNERWAEFFDLPIEAIFAREPCTRRSREHDGSPDRQTR